MTNSQKGQAAGQASSPVVSGTSGGGNDIPIITTRPEQITRHNISDEELSRFEDCDNKGLSGAIWMFGGIVGGLVIPIVSDLKEAYWNNPEIPLTLIALLQVIVFFVCFAVGVFIYFYTRQNKETASDLANKIRQRSSQS